ncbi:MAG TPA: NAD(P)-dependent oxidoreductase [Candidatus Paceibacterota bacterium]
MENFWKNKKVLITGADGFIGSHLAARLVELGAIVHAVVGPRKQSWRLDALAGQVTLLDADLNEVGQVRQLFEEHHPSIVFNTAAINNTEKSLEHAESIIQNTYGIARNVIEAAARAEVERLVQFGSIEEYGACEAPFVESMREEHFSPYSLGKVMATQCALMTARLTPMQVRIVRPAATYGPAQSFGLLVARIIKAGLEGKDFDMNAGEQLRDFMYVDDVVEGALRAAMHEGAQGEIFNLGNNRAVCVKEVAQMVNEAMGSPININFGARPYRPLDSMVFYMNSDKAKRLLDWEPKTSLADGIKKTVAWYQEHWQERGAYK